MTEQGTLHVAPSKDIVYLQGEYKKIRTTTASLAQCILLLKNFHEQNESTRTDVAIIEALHTKYAHLEMILLQELRRREKDLLIKHNEENGN